jgi:hypothetical protein
MQTSVLTKEYRLDGLKRRSAHVGIGQEKKTYTSYDCAAEEAFPTIGDIGLVIEPQEPR